MSNLDFWNDVCETDPSHTKKVNQRGGFTAIDAQSQVRAATEAFGQIGKGWGYDCKYVYQHTVVVCELTFWYCSDLGSTGVRNSFGPIAGCSDMFGKKLDTDAPKKAMTDALTKALSHLGFNADVFLGLFDDNKYVADRTAQFAKEKYVAEVTKTVPADDIKLYQGYVENGDALALMAFMGEYGPEDPKRDAFFASWPKGQSTRMGVIHGDLLSKGRVIVQGLAEDISRHIANQDELGIVESWDDCAKIKKFIFPLLSVEEKEALKQRAASKAEDEACRSAVTKEALKQRAVSKQSPDTGEA